MSRRSASIRYAAYYAAVFLALGVYLPFWPVWLAHRGLAAADIGVLLALTSWVKVLALPPIARLSDASGRSKAVLCLLAALSVAAFAGFFAARGFWAILAVQLLSVVVSNGLIPLGESHTMRAVRAEGLDYGRIRLWGSVGFILGALGAGDLLTGRSPELLLWLILAAMLATLGAALALPAGTRPPPRGSAEGGLRALARDRRFLIFLLGAGLIQASHAVYYAFSALHWRAAGHSEATVGWLWAEGVAAEIIFFALSSRLMRSWSPGGLLALAATAGIVRWSVLAGSVDLAALIAVQALHALTFGAAHLAAMHFIAGRAPPALAGTAQGLYAAFSGGAAMGFTILLTGWLYESFEGRAFLAMAALSAAGLLVVLPLMRPEPMHN